MVFSSELDINGISMISIASPPWEDSKIALTERKGQVMLLYLHMIIEFNALKNESDQTMISIF